MHPRYALENDNVTLMGVTATQAYFCVSDPDFNVYETKLAPFVFITQYFKAVKLLVMPMSSFHRLAAEAGDPRAKLSFVNMTARCGSTLLSQMMSRVPKVRAMSEPWAFVHAHGLYLSGQVSMAEYERLLRSVVRLQCKRENDSPDIEHVFVKMTAIAAPYFPMLRKMYPDATYVFNTRHLKNTVQSYMQIWTRVPKIALHLHKMKPVY